MRKVFGIAAAISSLLMMVPLTAASAADLPVKVLPPAPPPCVWCGWYLGINAGGSWGDDPTTYSQPGTANLVSTTLHPSGGIFGGQFGYNWQQGNFVFGMEEDLNFRHGSATTAGLLPNPADVIDQLTVTHSDQWFDTFRGRVGWALGNVLLYGTGGVAVGEIDHSYNQVRVTTGSNLALTDSVFRAGWTAGAGAEWMVWRNISLGVEYLHVDLGRTTLVQPVAILSGGVNFPPSQTSFSNRSDMVRAKLNFYFNEPPVVAKY